MKGLELIQPRLADYELIDCGDGAKLERFGDRIVARPEPQALWQSSLPPEEWERMADATFWRDDKSDERGRWTLKPGVPERWTMGYDYKGMHLRMRLALTGFKHVGVFPEQSANWDFIYDTICGTSNSLAPSQDASTTCGDSSLRCRVRDRLRSVSESLPSALADGQRSSSVSSGFSPTSPRVLNLFAYTGGATLAARSAGAEVTHVDSVKQTVGWAADNAKMSGLEGVRWIVDDALKFVRREVRRGSLYDGIVLDPPAYGRGPDGEKWVLEQNLDEMLSLCSKLLNPGGFFVLNLYSMGLSALLARTAVHRHFGVPPTEQFGELYFTDRAGKQLPLGVFYRFVR